MKRLLKRVEERLSQDEGKATFADYIRLVQLQKEIDEETPREIKVTWVEPEEDKPETTESEPGE